MQALRQRHERPPRHIAGKLLAVLFALPWLVATHAAPWTMFHADALMALAFLVLASWAIARRRERWRITLLPLGVAGLALVALLQAATGQIGYPSEAVVAALFLAGFMLAILTGLNDDAAAPGRAAEALLAGLAIAAIASVGLQLVQWLDLDGLGVLALPLPLGGRPSANVGQPNLLATLLVWGLVALWWAYETARIGAATGTLCAGYLLLGIAMTQSRTGWLEVALLAAAAFTQAKSFKRAPPARAVLLLAAWFVVAVVAWPGLGEALSLDPAAALSDRSAPGKRPEIWRLAIDAIAARPWTGWGWNQGGVAHVALAGAHPGLNIQVPYMHNLVLDLMLWIGIPLGALATLGLGGWFVLRWREPALPALQRLLLLALAALLIHALLELPHGHALFLLPAGLMMGVVDARSGASNIALLPRWAIGGLILTSALALITLGKEHSAIEADLFALRMHAARIANLPPLGPAPEPILMASYGELLASLRVAPAEGMSDVDLARLRRVAYHFPSTGNLLRLAQAEALNGRPEAASAALTLLCVMQPAADCERVGRHWRELAQAAQPALAAVEPPDPVVRAARDTAP